MGRWRHVGDDDIFGDLSRFGIVRLFGIVTLLNSETFRIVTLFGLMTLFGIVTLWDNAIVFIFNINVLTHFITHGLTAACLQLLFLRALN